MDKKIKSLKTLLIVLGSLIVFSNSTGLLFNSMMFSATETKPSNGIDLLFANYGLICLLAIIIGIFNLMGGILLNSKKAWTRSVVIMTSIISFICIIGFSILMVIVSINEGIDIGSSLAFLLSGLVFSSPFVILVIKLNKPKTKKHFT